MSVERYFSVEIGITFNSIAMLKLFSRIDMIGIRSRTAVSKSMPVKPIAASPQTLMQSLWFCQFGAHGEPQTVAKLRGLAPADIGQRLDRLPERRQLIARAARIGGDDGVPDVDGA